MFVVVVLLTGSLSSPPKVMVGYVFSVVGMYLGRYIGIYVCEQLVVPIQVQLSPNYLSYTWPQRMR